jgi:hypothetical protein
VPQFIRTLSHQRLMSVLRVETEGRGRPAGGGSRLLLRQGRGGQQPSRLDRDDGL